VKGEGLPAWLPLLPRAIAWATTQSQQIHRSGQSLNEQGIKIARAVGVAYPERIRVLVVPAIPSPDDPELKQLARDENLIGQNTGGLTLGYGIFIVQGLLDVRLLSHECRHVHQVEAAGGLECFLALYLQQIADVGYDHAPYELDALRHELTTLPEY
jgi:hypothetical protein